MKRLILLAAMAATVSAQEARPARISENVKAVRRQMEEMRKAKAPSCSVGTRSNCKLQNACALPEKGMGYRIGAPGRKTNFGTDEMVFGLMELGALMVDRHADQGVFYVGDISAENGGKLSPHINHQGGRDVDLGLYVCDESGRFQGNRMMTFDKAGKGEGTMRFDVVRNWDFVGFMLESPWFQDMHNILLADWLKKLLLEHARAQLPKIRNPLEYQRQTELIKKAEQKIIQPSSSPHDNHMHLALACTREDRKGG
jgi:penicillin-insensitive murein endopeptidase